VASVGVTNLIIVETPDAVLVMDRSQSQNVKKIVKQLEQQKRSELNLHRKVNRPWGWYDSIDEGERFKVKRIQVNPGASLSLQKHHYRAEHWVVVKGTAEITNADQLKPELNILIGTIILGQKIDTDWGTENGEMKLDRVIAVYNAGAYGTTCKLARSKKYKTPQALASVVNSITAGYIKKMLGQDGALDIAYTDKIFTAV
jgi:hypothetical protein